MRRPLVYSLLLHATVVLIAVVAAFLPSSSPLFVEQPLDVELVNIGEKTSTPPAVARQPRPEPARPSTPPPKPEPESKAEPESKPEPAPKPEPVVRPAPAPKPEPEAKPPTPEPAPKPEPVVKAPPKPPEPPARVEPAPKAESPPKPAMKPSPPEPERKPEAPKAEPPKPVVAKVEPEQPPAPKPVPPKPAPEKPVQDKPAPEKPLAEKPPPKAEPPKPETAAKPAPKPETPSDFASVIKSVNELKQQPPKAGDQPQAKPKAADAEPSLEQRLAQALKSPSPAASQLAQPMTMSEIDAIRRQIERCWNLPAGAKDAGNLVVAIRVEMNTDGTPRTAAVENQAEMRANPFFRSAAESALRAVLNPRCHPFKLPPEKYDRWKSMTLVFNPKEMAGT